MGNNFLGICQGVVFSHEKIHQLDPSKQPRTLANLLMLGSQIPNAELWFCLCSALGFFNLALLNKKPRQMASVVFQSSDNLILIFNHFETVTFQEEIFERGINL